MKTLISLLVVIFSTQTTLAFPIPGERIPMPLPRCRILSKTFYVDTKFRGSSDGSVLSPFITFSQALNAATLTHVCKLEILAAGGTYKDTLTIDRNTIISATGAHVEIKGSIINFSGSSLKLNNIHVGAATDVGIHQNGGKLEINNGSINWTNKSQDANKPLSGTALILSGAVKANLNNVQIAMNQNRGIYITDLGSVLWGNQLVLLRNGNQGIEITNVAKAFFDNIIVEENVKAGIFISNRSKVNIKNSRIRFSKFTAPNTWGTNIVVTNNSILELFNFNISAADSTGIAFDNAFVTASTGQIDNNIIGLAYFNTTYNIVNCIADTVTFTGNQSKAGGGVPLPSECRKVDDACMQQHQCARVPWENYE